MSEFQTIGKSVKKIDALSLATGSEKFVDDFALDNPLHLAILYSPHAHARIRKLDLSQVETMDGVIDILHSKNVPHILHTTAGQGYPEPSPYDSVLFDDTVRFVGDRVAVVAAESLETAREAVRKIEVEYDVLEPVFDPEKSMAPQSPRISRHDAYAPIPVTYKPEQNLAAEVDLNVGDMEKGFAEADFIVENDYFSHYASHCAIEPHAAVAFVDERGRLVILASTQVPFHVRRIVGKLLQIPTGMIRVIKPRIGGGFGGKQEVFLEPLVALAAWRNKRPARIVLSRGEVFTASRTRHPMRVRMKTGVKENGVITAMEMDAVLNSGAYGSHALTVLSNTGSKVLPLFNKIENLRFFGRSVYTNLPVGGAYRGYGATQGYFAFCQQIDIITRKIGQDILEYYKKWHIKEGETSPIFEALGEGKEGVGQNIRSCCLSECIDKGAEAIGWTRKRNKRVKTGPDTFKGVGVAVAMQGSGIPRVDMAAASMKMNDDGSFNLHVGATDLGTGSDTILAQIAAEVLQVPIEKIIVLSSDTDITPFDTGAYASSTTYVSGNAVKICAEKIRKQILEVAASMLKTTSHKLTLGIEKVVQLNGHKELSLEKVACHSLYTADQFQIQANASYVGDESPPPFIAQFAEVDVDRKTGRVDVIKFVTAVDCGQAIHPRLAEGQVEGAVINGISYALCEEYLFSPQGKMKNDSFWDYKIYTAADIPEMKTIIVGSSEITGPFGAKSVGEIAINGPLPAIANAIYDAVGVRIFDAPFTQEKVLNKLMAAADNSP